MGFHDLPQGQDLTRAISREEVIARLGDQECEVKTLDNTHLYCEPPEIQPMSADDSNKLPSLKVHEHTACVSVEFQTRRLWVFILTSSLCVSQVLMGKLQVDLGLVQYDSDSLLSPVPLAAQIGLGAGAAVIILSVLVVILMYRYLT